MNKTITELKPNEIFVFGSNLKGIHGKGAARQALAWGAKHGFGHGLQGNTYAIPTKSSPHVILPLSQISIYVDKFIEFAKKHQHLDFLVTAIGCGLAKYTPTEIAPLFQNAKNASNVFLPKEFCKILMENDNG